jgi:hypothetical protein
MGRGVSRRAKDHYFRTTGIAADANIAARNKMARRYVMEKTLVQGVPVARRTKSTPSVKDTMPIGARIMMSRKSLRIDGGVFCENLGVLESRKWAHPYEFLQEQPVGEARQGECFILLRQRSATCRSSMP